MPVGPSGVPKAAFIPFSPPLLGDAEKAEVLDTLDSGWITTGPKTKRFETGVASYVGARHALAVSSGTAALHLAMVGAGVSENDEVITSPFTFAATGHVILYQRARPIFVDIDETTLNVDPDAVESKITPRTKAILAVHYGGCPCEMDRLMQIAKRHGLLVVEDAAHAIGAVYRDRHIGQIGDLTCFSFYATKNLTTAEGGMVTGNDEKVIQRLRVLSMYGISDAREIWHTRYQPGGTIHYDVEEIGFKYNMTDIQAAIGLHQLARLEEGIATRAGYAKSYNEAFESLPELRLPKVPNCVRSAWHLYPVQLNLEMLTVSRDQFHEELKREGIGTSVLFKPLHLHSAYQRLLNVRAGDFPVAERVFSRIINLPLSPKATLQDIKRVIEAVHSAIRRYRR